MDIHFSKCKRGFHQYQGPEIRLKSGNMGFYTANLMRHSHGGSISPFSLWITV